MNKADAFHEAYLDFERLNIGGFDPLSHTSPGDLWSLVLLEVDLFDEGEETDIKSRRQYAMAKRYLRKWGCRS